MVLMGISLNVMADGRCELQLSQCEGVMRAGDNLIQSNKMLVTAQENMISEQHVIIRDLSREIGQKELELRKSEDSSLKLIIGVGVGIVLGGIFGFGLGVVLLAI